MGRIWGPGASVGPGAEALFEGGRCRGGGGKDSRLRAASRKLRWGKLAS